MAFFSAFLPATNTAENSRLATVIRRIVKVSAVEAAEVLGLTSHIKRSKRVYCTLGLRGAVLAIKRRPPAY